MILLDESALEALAEVARETAQEELEMDRLAATVSFDDEEIINRTLAGLREQRPLEPVEIQTQGYQSIRSVDYHRDLLNLIHYGMNGLNGHPQLLSECFFYAVLLQTDLGTLKLALFQQGDSINLEDLDWLDAAVYIDLSNPAERLEFIRDLPELTDGRLSYNEHLQSALELHELGLDRIPVNNMEIPVRVLLRHLGWRFDPPWREGSARMERYLVRPGSDGKAD